SSDLEGGGGLREVDPRPRPAGPHRGEARGRGVQSDGLRDRLRRVPDAGGSGLQAGARGGPRPEHGWHGVVLPAGPPIAVPFGGRPGPRGRAHREDRLRPSRGGSPVPGILYGGFMLTANGPRLVEFNARLGDPEGINALALYEPGDFAALLYGVATGSVDPNLVRFRLRATVVK